MRRRGLAKPGLLYRIGTIGDRRGDRRGQKAPDAPMERCLVTGKRRYVTLGAAEAAAEAWGTHNRWEPSYAYPCRHCDGFHLTHDRRDVA